jgi:hypothetical protein
VFNKLSSRNNLLIAECPGLCKLEDAIESVDVMIDVVEKEKLRNYSKGK